MTKEFGRNSTAWSYFLRSILWWVGLVDPNMEFWYILFSKVLFKVCHAFSSHEKLRLCLSQNYPSRGYPSAGVWNTSRTSSITAYLILQSCTLLNPDQQFIQGLFCLALGQLAVYLLVRCLLLRCQITSSADLWQLFPFHSNISTSALIFWLKGILT